jgi:hypothetical protein
MKIDVSPDLKDMIRARLAELEELMEGRERWISYPLVHEVNREIGDAIEEWVKTRLDELVPADDIWPRYTRRSLGRRGSRRRRTQEASC